MSYWLVLAVLFYCANVVILQGTGSGKDGNLRLCIVEGRGYKRGARYCPILDEEKSGIECVFGVDRLDCLRRIHKGSADFGVFQPEDLIAAQWADVDVLVTNEVKLRDRPFARSVVAAVNRRILSEEHTSPSAVLRNRKLCRRAADEDDYRHLPETLARYLESLVTAGSCAANLTLTENRIKANADFFGDSCVAGPWLADQERDAELKRIYPSLCAACKSRRCSETDLFSGNSGALGCMAEGVGDVTWAELDDVVAYFKDFNITDEFALLCRDGSWQPLDSKTPCVWLHRPWDIIVSKRKASEAVSKLTSSMTNSSVTVDSHWHGALAALLEIRQALPPPLQPAQAPMDYLSTAKGFREAFSQNGCNPPRHVTLCTTSLLENNKCEWLAEAGAVYGVNPPLQCARRNSTEGCMMAVKNKECDGVIADSDWLVMAKRNYSLTPILHEANPIIDRMTTISAYVRRDAGINKMTDLRGKRAAFPRLDGVAWHSVLRYLMKNQNKPCKDIAFNFFSEVCALGLEKFDLKGALSKKYTEECGMREDDDINGEIQALRALAQGKTDVVFISKMTYNLYSNRYIQKDWSRNLIELMPICPEENPKYCFLSWSSIGHIFTSNNLTSLRRHEVINVLTKLDQYFGDHPHKSMFSMYGPYDHVFDVLFHNNTKLLATDHMFKMHPYNNIPLNFEQSLNASECYFSNFTTGSGVKMTPTVLLLIMSLVFSLILIN